MQNQNSVRLEITIQRVSADRERHNLEVTVDGRSAIIAPILINAPLREGGVWAFPPGSCHLGVTFDGTIVPVLPPMPFDNLAIIYEVIAPPHAIR